HAPPRAGRGRRLCRLLRAGRDRGARRRAGHRPDQCAHPAARRSRKPRDRGAGGGARTLSGGAGRLSPLDARDGRRTRYKELSSPPMSPDPDACLARLRAICLALPRGTEKVSHGQPVFFIEKGKTFAWFLHNHHGSGITAVAVKTSGAEEQDMLIEADPDLYY